MNSIFEKGKDRDRKYVVPIAFIGFVLALPVARGWTVWTEKPIRAPAITSALSGNTDLRRVHAAAAVENENVQRAPDRTNAREIVGNLWKWWRTGMPLKRHAHGKEGSA
ncbi:hypothetical protein [Rhizobium sp. GR12]|uniref:hypothetical protein n=1 Tax=Rhizobium sp. GR12 TaxID=3053925 RepID=UPI002FBD6011